MSSERWQQTKQILDEALRFAPDRRAAYLDAACGSDHGLRAELESLIASHEAAGSQLLAAAAPDPLHVTPPNHPRMSLVAGSRLGPYEILVLVGTGLIRGDHDDGHQTSAIPTPRFFIRGN